MSVCKLRRCKKSLGYESLAKCSQNRIWNQRFDIVKKNGDALGTQYFHFETDFLFYIFIGQSFCAPFEFQRTTFSPGHYGHIQLNCYCWSLIFNRLQTFITMTEPLIQDNEMPYLGAACVICLDTNLKDPTILDGCQHHFCYECINQWLLTNPRYFCRLRPPSFCSTDFQFIEQKFGLLCRIGVQWIIGVQNYFQLILMFSTLFYSFKDPKNPLDA